MGNKFVPMDIVRTRFCFDGKYTYRLDMSMGNPRFFLTRYGDVHIRPVPIPAKIYIYIYIYIYSLFSISSNCLVCHKIH